MDAFIRRVAVIIMWAFTAIVYFGGFMLMEAREPVGLLLYLTGLGLIVIATVFSAAFWSRRH